MSTETKRTEERLSGLLDTLDAASDSLQKQVEALRGIINTAKGRPGPKGEPGPPGPPGEQGKEAP